MLKLLGALFTIAMISMAQGSETLKVSRPFQLQIPFPTEGHGSKLVRHGKVAQSDSVAVIYWEKPKQGSTPWSHFEVSTAGMLLSGIHNKNDALNHFELQLGIKKSELESIIHTNAVREDAFPFGTVVTIDLSALGLEPGNSYAYIISRDMQGKAIYFGPMYFLAFDWSKASVVFGPKEP